jgi:signal transduction histidine kinase
MPFRQFGSAASGGGLGLSIVQWIASLHGGEAELALRPGEPSCIRISLPAVSI